MFLNVIMLAGIGGAAVPLVLHLLNRARYRSVDWGAMMFLYGDNARHRQSTRIKQLILLLLRMALVALLAITLARPLAAARWNPMSDSSNTTSIILFDRSGSMGCDENGHSRFDQGREAVRQILASLHHGDEATLITLGDSSRDSVPHSTTDLQSINDSLAAGKLSKPAYGVANIADGLKTAADTFDRNRSSNRALFLVCDRQALNWKALDEKATAAWRARMSVPGPTPRFLVVPVGGEQADNVAVESINVLSPQVVADQPVDIEITVANYGPTPRAAVPLTLEVGGKLTTTSVNVAAKTTTVVRLPIKLHTPGSHSISARIESTGMVSDDRLQCAVDVISPVSVLIVSGEAHRKNQLNQAEYLKLALMPFTAVGRGGADVAAVQVVTPSSSEDWGNFDSKKFRVVILADVPDLTQSQARALEQHVYGGGGLLVAPGALTHVDNLNTLLYRDGAGILPAQLKTATPADGSGATSILGIELSHPVFRFLKGKPDPIPSAAVGRYFPSAIRQPDAHVLSSFASGLPFVVEGNFGRGKVLLVTSPLDGDWGTLPLTNFYLPMVQSAVRFLASRPNRNLRPGEPIIADFDDAGGATRAHLTMPSGAQMDIPLQPTGDQFEARYTEAAEPGIYTVTVPHEKLHFVVQATREESDITPLTADRWQELSKQLGFKIVDAGSAPLGELLSDDRAKRELWPILLASVLFLGVAEIGLARLWSREAV